MKAFLAIDTAASYLTVIARNRQGKTVTSHLCDCAMNHSVKLLERVEKTLEEAETSLSDFDFFSCVIGAGSFTGIRIGISTVKGFCTATDKPSLPVTSFDAIAYTTGRVSTLSVVSAGHNYYYVCGYNAEKEVILPPAYRSYEEVCVLRQDYAVLAGYEELPFENAVRADMKEGLLLAVEGKSERAENFLPCEGLQALYVRKSQAEEQRK
ncbi:MAG: tRNA (adenosine(37)-N6)-threonylcarbamoyltransferase complex dimerization subunit type 1 TsaB [Clostridia bacterium]|nr:tRNA (adenosine(37)-N6)-threonylcarbamoyltransferase complex dimerization subunit type 1 TsaB [Clostridia bacterium]